MNQTNEHITLSNLMNKLKVYIERNQIKLDPYLRRSYSKMDPSLFKSYLNTIQIDIMTEKRSPFSHLSRVKILNIYPYESLYILIYILDTYSEYNKTQIKLKSNIDLMKEQIQINIYDDSSNNFIARDFLNLATNISLLSRKMKMDIPKINEKYPISKTQVVGVKKSITGTFFEEQSSKYFKPKYNKAPGTCIPIEDLVTNKKNYLKAEANEIIVVKCSICKNKLHTNYYNIKQLFKIEKDTVTLKCLHPETKYIYSSKQHKFKIDKNLIKKYNKKDVLMYIINNRRYYGLSVNKKTTK